MIQNTEIINPALQHFVFQILIIMGVCSLFLGFRILGMNRKNLANQKGLFLCISSFLWSVGYGWILVASTEQSVYLARFVGMLGVYSWMAMALSYFFELGESKKRPQLCSALTIMMLMFSVLIAIQAVQPGDITVITAKYGVTFMMNDSIHKKLRYLYIGVVMIFATVLVLRWYLQSRLKRNRKIGLLFILAMALFPVGAILDAIVPYFGYPLFPSSCFTSFFATCILYYVTKTNNAFSISSENVAHYVSESVRTPFFILNHECEIILMNRSGKEFLGRNAKNAQNVNCDVFFQGEEYALTQEINRRISRHVGNFNVHGTCITNNAMCNLQFSIVYDRYGDCICIIMLVNDITSEYAAITELKKSQQAEERANRAKTIFLANMSHEIRTPINTILGMDEMILRETGESTTREYAVNIQNSGKLLMSLINDILDFSRIESGKMEIVSSEYEISSLLNDIVNMAHVKAEDKGLKFHINVDEKLPHRLYGDEMRIRQVISNIITNAVKYTQKGEVRLNVAWKLISPNRLILMVDVSDTGIGIKREDMDKIFMSFERADTRKNRSIEGSGLGLSITSQLLELMNGRMNIESEYGKGSDFHIEIPQKIVEYEPVGNYKKMYEESVRQNKKYQQRFIAPGANILVVDDNDMNLAVVQGFLKKTKMNLTTAVSGEECLRLLLTEQYDIIFMDHMMPQMDGIEVLNRIKEIHPDIYEHVPIIALTANAMSGAREKYLGLGFTDYLAKPIESAKMEQMLLRYLPEKLIQIQQD